MGCRQITGFIVVDLRNRKVKLLHHFDYNPVYLLSHLSTKFPNLHRIPTT